MERSVRSFLLEEVSMQSKKSGENKQEIGTALESLGKAATKGANGPTLPTVGLSRWDTLCVFVPVSRETWRKLVNAGRAPAAIRLSERCTMYSNFEVHRWLADPANYSA